MTNLLILGMLLQRPMHGYELQQQIQSQRLDVWSNVLSGSIYYALNKMEHEGLVVTESEERTGARLRKTYAITEQGRQTFMELLRSAMVQPPHETGSAFFTMIPWLSFLEKRDALVFLQQNKQRLEDMRLVWVSRREERAVVEQTGPILWAMDNTIEIIDADLRFMRKLMQALE
ncbi:PadR family transcriptional regulator [Paenibacillus rigui]|uniref:PadR family transcriptional regulator n=1 Tax=Paenibacillus rigui TaxID=554312 RepID=A0A229UV81_9BACL|nr:PadR family transcriptional regulator [Paenibacillus rigui]OXM87161.1 PadR family transcriptional regulator [Paenibacillus rigui]